MTASETNSIAPLLKDMIVLDRTTAELHSAYKKARPFPHLILNNLFSPKLLEDLLAEIPPMRDASWVHHDEEHLVKSNLRSAVELGKTGNELVAFLHSARFLYLISEVTGIWGLVPDPYLGGSGYHVVPRGGKFDIHADRNVDQTTGLTRRIAMIIYLNKRWGPEDGGQLELWNYNATRCEVVVEPIFNRTIVFEVADQNFHGVQPVLCADGRSRISFAVYYHTVGGMRSAPHSSIYAPSFYLNKKKKWTVRDLVSDLAPPVVVRGYRRLRKKQS
jgi:2OG-Fe(II) oxygenase superfamily